MDALTKTVLILALVALVAFFLVYGASIFIPLAVALLLWFFLNALAGAYRRVSARWFQMPRALALALALATIFAGSMLIAHLIVGSLSTMSQQADNFDDGLSFLIDQASQVAGIKSEELENRIVNMVQVETLIGNIVSGMASLASQFTVVFIYVIFLLIEQRLFDTKLRAVIPNNAKRARVQAVLNSIAEDVQSYLWIMTWVSALTALLSYGVMVWVGLDQAFFWAVLIFVLNFIPTIGPIVATALPAIYALVQFQDFTPFLWILLGVGVIQFVIGNVVQPRVSARSLNLSQFVVILSLFVWGAIWGVVGMFLAVPIVAILMLVFANIEATRPVAMMLSETGDIGDAAKTKLTSGEGVARRNRRLGTGAS
jgi:AI-2 transport protein TqsA